MDNYEAAWKALRIALLQRECWTSRELHDLMTQLELEYLIGGALRLPLRGGSTDRG